MDAGIIRFSLKLMHQTFYSNEDVYSPMKAAQQEHKHTDRNTNVKDRQRTELSKDIQTRIHVYETKVFSLLKIQSKPTQHPVLTP